MSQHHNRDTKYPSNNRSNQYQKQGYSHNTSSYQSSYRPPYYNSSYQNSSYRQNDHRPYQRDSRYHDKPYGQDKYRQDSYNKPQYHNDRQSCYNSRFTSKQGPSYSYRNDYKSSRQAYSKEPIEKESTGKYESNPKKYQNQKQRSRSRNKQYNNPSRDYKYESSYNKPYYKDDNHYQTKKQQYNQKPYPQNDDKQPFSKKAPSTESQTKKNTEQAQPIHNIEIEFSSASKRSDDDNYKHRESNLEKNNDVEVKPARELFHDYEKFPTPRNSSYYPKNQPYYKEHRSFKQTNKDQPQSKDVISIQVKSRHRSPKRQKEHKHKKQKHSSKSISKSKSISRSKKSKSRSKRKYKKHNSSQSSSSSSSNSSSSSSSSSNNSSSSSSSRSSSSSQSRSVDSKHRKNYSKQHKDFYQRKDQYPRPQFYQSSYNSSYQKDRPYNQSQRPYFSNSTYEKGSQYSKKPEVIVQIKKDQTHEVNIDNKHIEDSKQLVQQNDKTTSVRDNQPQREQKHEKIQSQSSIGEPNQNNLPPITSTNSNELPQQIRKVNSSFNQQRYPYNRDFQPRDTYRKNYNPNYQPRQPYTNNRPYYNQHYNQNQQYNSQNIPTDYQNQPNPTINQSYPPFQNQPYQQSSDQKVSFNVQNDYKRQFSGNDNERKPYFNNYQNYPKPPHTNQSYPNSQAQNFTNYPYQQRFNQPYIPNRPYERTFPANQANQLGQNQQDVNQSTFVHPYSNQSYHPQQQSQSAYQPHFRRVVSQMVGQRKNPYYYQQIDTQATKIKSQAEKEEEIAALQQAFKRQADLKKINTLIPCSKVLALIQKARQNLTVPAIKSSFLALEVFKEMSNFKKQTMNPNLKNVLQSDLDKKYQDQKLKVFENLRLLNIASGHDKQNNNQKSSGQQNDQKVKQNEQKMDAQDVQNPQNKRLKQFIWKKPQMSQNLRVLKSNLEMMRKATSCLSEMSRKMKMKFDEKPTAQIPVCSQDLEY